MPNPVLERKRAERQHQIDFMSETLAKVDADGGRDLVEAETKNLAAARDRIKELDAQITPLEEYEALATVAASASGSLPRPDRSAGGHVPLGRQGGEAVYATAGSFLVDVLAARGMVSDRRGQRLPADPGAEARVRYAIENQTTADTPGLLPHAIVGQVVSLIDASRPFITSVGGGRSMGGIPGKTFGRPKITQHTLAGEQTAEKTELPSRKMVIGEVAFTKRTKGGAVDVSRQDIDWSSPAAWDILIRDLADAYAIDTENEAADAFAAGAATVNAATPVPTGDLAGISSALYTAAGLVYASSKRLPDRIWMATDVWGKIGPLLDTACCGNGSQGDSSFASFSGNLYGVSRIVVPSFPAGTLIVGTSSAFEVYEETIGLLTAVEPSLLGVEVAYGGYIAFNYVAAEGVAPLGPVPAPPPLAREAGDSRQSKG